MTEDERKVMIEDFWLQATTGLRPETEIMKENFRFYVGGDGQWDQQVLVELDEDGKPHLSINKCKPTIDLLSGYQRKYRNSLIVFPRRGGTAQAAKNLTHMGRHAMDVSRPNGDYVLSEQFMMAAIGGKWWSKLGISYQWDPMGGDIQPQSVSCFDILEDPLYRGYDINSNDPFNFNRFIFQLYALTIEQLKLLYPDVEEMAEGITTDEGPFTLTSSPPSSDYDNSAEMLWRPDYSILGGKERRYWVRQCWYKKFKTTAFLQNKESGQIHNLGDKTQTAKRFADSNPDLTAVVRVMPELSRSTWLGQQEIEFKKDPLRGLAEYPYFRFCPYFVDGKPLGELDNLKDPQKELNKRRSQLLHHLNSSANSGVWLEEDSVSDPQKTHIEQNLGRPGFVGIYKKTMPTPIDPARLSEGHLKAALLSSQDFEEISKLNDAVYGLQKGRSKESGEALKTRREQGLAAKEVAFDNFRYTELAFYAHMLEIVRRPDENGNYVYSDEEILMLIEEKDLDIDLETLRSMETGRYGIKIAQSEAQPTVRKQNFIEFMEMMNISPKLQQDLDSTDILEASDLTNKEILIEKIESRRKQMAQQQQQGQLAG